MAKGKKKQGKKWVWPVVIFLVLVVIVAILLFAFNNKGPAEEEQTQEQEETTETPVEEGQLQEITYQPLMDLKCDTSYVIGYDPRSAKCEEMANGNFMLTIKNSGRGDLPGLWFYVIPVDGEKVYFKSETGLKVGESKEFELKINDWEAQVGNIIGVEVQPMKIVGGDEYACVNQRIIAIADSTCKN